MERNAAADAAELGPEEEPDAGPGAPGTRGERRSGTGQSATAGLGAVGDEAAAGGVGADEVGGDVPSEVVAHSPGESNAAPAARTVGGDLRTRGAAANTIGGQGTGPQGGAEGQGPLPSGGAPGTRGREVGVGGESESGGSAGEEADTRTAGRPGQNAARPRTSLGPPSADTAEDVGGGVAGRG
jgi:hypothetical protein